MLQWYESGELKSVTTFAAEKTRNPGSSNSSNRPPVTKLSDVIRPTQYLVNGQQMGYRVYPGRSRQIFNAMGLRPGDVMTNIDGISLTDPITSITQFKLLAEKEEASVTVIREGEPETLVLDTSVITPKADD